MKVLIVGGTGIIGKAVVQELLSDHEVVTAGYRSGDVQVDVTSEDSIKALFETQKNVDAVVSATGQVRFAPLETLDDEAYQFSLQNKLMGQVNLVRIGMQYLNDKGSFTLTSGVLNHDPIYMGTTASMVNGAIEGFVRAAAIELPRGLRINCVSPTVISEAMEAYAPYFKGFKPVSAAEAALAYRKSIDGLLNGEVFRVGY